MNRLSRVIEILVIVGLPVVIILFGVVACTTEKTQTPATPVPPPLLTATQAAAQMAAEAASIVIDSTGQKLAVELADKLTQATTDNQRLEAMLFLMKALSIGVYTPDGKVILSGGERSASDFYLYDFEVEMMAQGLGRQETWTIDSLLLTLQQMGIQPQQGTLSAADLWGAMRTGMDAARQAPDDRFSVVPLSVREISLRQTPQIDLLTVTSPTDVKLNTLQTWLSLIELTVPLIHNAKLASGSSNLPAITSGIVKIAHEPLGETAKVAQQSNPCKDIGNVAKEFWPFGKWILPFLPLPKVISGVKLAAPIIDGLHGMVLAYSVKVQAVEDRVGPAYYGQGRPGDQLQFKISVEMQDQLPDAVVNCGWLLGVEFPKKGPIEGVTVIWEDSNDSDKPLPEYGTVNCGNPCSTKTGADGIATVTFIANCEFPPYGMEIEQTGVVSGYAMYLTRFKNVLGAVAQVGTPKWGATRWFVRYHQPEHYAIQVEEELDGSIGAYGAHENITGQAKIPIAISNVSCEGAISGESNGTRTTTVTGVLSPCTSTDTVHWNITGTLKNTTMHLHLENSFQFHGCSSAFAPVDFDLDALVGASKIISHTTPGLPTYQLTVTLIREPD